MKQTKLIELYCTVCDNHSIIEEKTQRLRNNRFPKFTDEERITAFLRGQLEGRLTRASRNLVVPFLRHGVAPPRPGLPLVAVFALVGKHSF